MKHYCYINGKIQSIRNAVIGISDLALQRGYGVFDFARTYNGILFHFNDHIERLKRSATALHMKLPISDSEIYKISEQLIEDSELKRPSIRLILTGGYTSTIPELEYPNFIIIAEELPTYPKEVYTKGTKLITVEYQRELPHIKTINYLNAIRLEPLKRERQAFDILYYSNKGVTECTRDNFFIFQGDTLITTAEHILHGITRKIVLKLSRDYFQINERSIAFNKLKNADEAFITSTSKGIIPVIKIDDQEIGSGVIGNRTKTIMKLFDNYTKDYQI
jgi:branched-chain amino acid aminotransferase